jgi:hypothetical protein
MHTEKFGVSSKMQSLICLLASNSVFEEAAESFHDLLGIDISAKQIQRISEYYGQQLEEFEVNYQETVLAPPRVDAEASQSPVYIGSD